MTMIFGRISDTERSAFISKFAAYYTLDPAGQTWQGLAEILDTVKNRIEFRHAFGWSDMVLMLRELCVAGGLTREDRIIGDGHVDQTEGYYGIEKV